MFYIVAKVEIGFALKARFELFFCVEKWFLTEAVYNTVEKQFFTYCNPGENCKPNALTQVSSFFSF